MKNNHFIWKIDPPSHRCRGTWIIRVLASKCPEIGMLPWFFIPIVEFIIQLLSKFTRISHFCTKKFQQGDIGWYICHLLLMWIFIWICPVLMSFVLVKFSRGVYRPLWSPSPMSIRQPMLGQDRVMNSAIFYYLLDSMVNRRWICTLQWKWWYWGEWTLLPIFSTCAHLIMVN